MLTETSVSLSFSSLIPNRNSETVGKLLSYELRTAVAVVTELTGVSSIAKRGLKI